MPPRILIVDTDGDVRTLIRTLLEDDYLHIDEAEDRDHTTRLLATRSYAALVIESEGLLDESGILRLVRRERPEVLSRTIALVSAASEGLLDDVASRGVAVVMRKPVDAAKLRVAIRNLTSTGAETARCPAESRLFTNGEFEGTNA